MQLLATLSSNFTCVVWMLHQVGLCETDLRVMWVLLGKAPPRNTVAPPSNAQRGKNAQTQMERSNKVLKKTRTTVALHCTEQITN